MLLFTTTPASAMKPMPDMTMTKVWPVSSMPSSAPIIAMTTQVSTRNTRGELVELRQQHDEDQEDRRAEGIDQEGAGLGAVLVGAGELPVDAGLGHVADDLAHRRLHLGDLEAAGHVGLDGDGALGVDAVQDADRRFRACG